MKKRWIVYVGVLLLLVISIVPALRPVRPVIQLPGEIVTARGVAVFGGLTNTFIATLLTFFILIILAFAMRAKSRTADEVPSGFYNFIEMIIEMMYGYVEDASGKWARTFFPFFGAFIFWIVTANWMGLVPGVDSIGKWETMGELRKHQAEAEYHAEFGHDLTAAQEEEMHALEKEADKAAQKANEGDLRVGPFLMNRGYADASATETVIDYHGHEELVGRNPEAQDWTIVPFVRPAATDLNFTLALGLISVVMTQFYGMKAQGMKYWSKFFTWDGDKIKKDPLAVIGTGVGLLEFVSEVFKIVSFAFRLLGNIFAGMVLLFVIGSLLPVGNLLFYFLEFGIGLLQGVVFALLTLTFMNSATEEAHH